MKISTCTMIQIVTLLSVLIVGLLVLNGEGRAIDGGMNSQAMDSFRIDLSGCSAITNTTELVCHEIKQATGYSMDIDADEFDLDSIIQGI